MFQRHLYVKLDDSWWWLPDAINMQTNIFLSKIFLFSTETDNFEKKTILKHIWFWKRFYFAESYFKKGFALKKIS